MKTCTYLIFRNVQCQIKDVYVLLEVIDMRGNVRVMGLQQAFNLRNHQSFPKDEVLAPYSNNLQLSKSSELSNIKQKFNFISCILLR